MSDIYKILNSYFKEPVTFVYDIKNICIFIDHVLVFSILDVDSKFLTFHYENNYDKKVHQEYVNLIGTVLKKYEYNINYSNSKRNLITKIKKMIGREDIEDEIFCVSSKCDYAERYFYNILRKGNLYYRKGVLIYFNHILVWVLKIYNDKTYLGFDDKYGKMLLLDVPREFRQKI